MKYALPTLASAVLFATSAQAVVLSYDESTDGDLGAPETPTFVVLDVGVNTVLGLVNETQGDVRDAFSFTVPANQVVRSILLTSYDDPATSLANDGNRGFYHIDDALTSEDPNGGGAAGFLIGRTFVFSELNGVNLLAAPGDQTGGLGIPGGELGAGDYTFAIQNTTTNLVSTYSLELDVAAVPEPAAPLLAGLGVLALAARRRR